MRLHRSSSLAVAALVLSTAAAGPPAAAAGAAHDGPLLGFGPEASRAQRQLEARFDAALDPADLRAWMQRLSARPHPVGSPWGKKNAEFMAELFRSWGYETALEEFWVLFPTPELRRLEMLAPEPFVAALAEPALAEDSTSAQTDEQLPVYNAYSADGDVSGELVYVNYGLPEDYEQLERRGIDVAGKIVIARYGAAWRGIKPKVAAEHGAVGCLIYSDPREDGYFQGDPYPVGGWRPETGAQRGSVADMPRYPGDPLTPGVGALAGAERLPRDEAETLTKIPVLPISATDARPLLAALGGPVAPEGWRGALPIPYHLGPGPARVRLQLRFRWELVPAYDVIARLPGADHPDQWVIRGNHHDAWVNGATDPISGMVALLAEAKAVGELVRGGWRPRRTLVYAAWDAEEPGLLGSVEWAETHADEVRAKAVAYVNSDSNERGYLFAGGSHTLERLVNQVAAEIDDPGKGIGVVERLRAWMELEGPPELKEAAREEGDLPLPALGSGSDYTPFLQHLGIASLNIGYGGEGHYGQYHSIYDSFDHFLRFMDPDFAYGIALARTAGRTVLRLAEAEILPFEFTGLARAVDTYAGEVVELADRMREETAERNRQIADGVFAAVAPPDEILLPPAPKDPVPHLNFAPLHNAAAALGESARAYAEALEAFSRGGRALAPEAARTLDALLLASERALTRPEGLPGRPWYVHQLYAPGFYTGYGVKTLPGVREAIEDRRWQEAEEQVERVAETLAAFSREVDRAAAILAAPATETPAP